MENLKTNSVTALPLDTIGTIGITEIPVEEKKNAKRLAAEILAANKHLQSVYEKTGAMHGEYRVWKLSHLAGKKSTKTTYRESDCLFELDVAKVYFSPRLAFERNRIAAQAQNGEKILALFAGVGPFPIIIAKKLKTQRKSAEIIANELNPIAVKYMQQNITLNKVGEIVGVNKGDAKKLLKQKKKWANRIITPLPHTAYKFLPQIIDATAVGGVVHLYGFGEHRNEKTKKKTNPFTALEKKIKTECRKKKRKCKIIFKRVVRPYSPFSVQVVIDFVVK